MKKEKLEVWEHYDLANKYLKQNKLLLAEHEIVTARLLDDKGQYKIMGTLVLIYIKTGRFYEAEDVILEYLEINPKDSRAHILLGTVELTQGKINCALNNFKNAKQIMLEKIDLGLEDPTYFKNDLWYVDYYLRNKEYASYNKKAKQKHKNKVKTKKFDRK